MKTAECYMRSKQIRELRFIQAVSTEANVVAGYDGNLKQG